MILDDTYAPHGQAASSSSALPHNRIGDTSLAESMMHPPPSYAIEVYPASFGAPLLSADKGSTLRATTPSHSNISTQSLQPDVSSSSQSYYNIGSSASSNPLRSPETPSLPTSFGRVPAQSLAYESFDPLFLIARGATLDKGFPPAPPPTAASIHPFVTHDIREDDWLSFLREAQTSATLTEKDIAKSHLSIVSSIPILDPLCAHGVQKYMKHRKRYKVVKVIETWNHHFFKLRKVYIVLMRGKNALHGPLRQKHQKDNISQPWNIDELTAGWDDDEYRLLVVSI